MRDGGQGAAPGGRGLHVEAFVAESHGHELGDVRLVVDDQDPGGVGVHVLHADRVSWEIAQRMVGFSFDSARSGHPAMR